jgi:phosphate acyltransferase
MLPIAVDAMGGDRAPEAIVAGARQAHDEFGIPVILVGRPDEIGDPGPLEVIEASEVIPMDADAGGSVRRMKDSSLVRAAEAVRDGRASAMVSAGNTGATMASALLRMGRIKGVSRPAIATPIPDPVGSPCVLLDAGANSDCQPEWLVQFAQMGAIYSRDRYGVARPRIGLLSIGEEPTKGNSLVKETHKLLADPAWADSVGAEFIGNIEGRDLMASVADVCVTDGFTGNVTLKSLEGGMRSLPPTRPARRPPRCCLPSSPSTTSSTPRTLVVRSCSASTASASSAMGRRRRWPCATRCARRRRWSRPGWSSRFAPPSHAVDPAWPRNLGDHNLTKSGGLRSRRHARCRAPGVPACPLRPTSNMAPSAVTRSSS